VCVPDLSKGDRIPAFRKAQCLKKWRSAPSRLVVPKYGVGSLSWIVLELCFWRSCLNAWLELYSWLGLMTWHSDRSLTVVAVPRRPLDCHILMGPRDSEIELSACCIITTKSIWDGECRDAVFGEPDQPLGGFRWTATSLASTHWLELGYGLG
jgi:hypothetical protein